MTPKDKDVALWKQWNKSKSTSDLSKLLHQVNPLIYTVAQQYAGNIAPAILEAEAKIQAVRAFNTYNPNKGTKLSTHLMNQLKKTSRFAYKHQEIYTVPEDRRIKYHTFNSVKSHLKDKYDRDPTIEELADSLKWSNSEVKRYHNEDIKELSDSQPIATDSGFYKHQTDPITSYIYNDLAPDEKVLMESITGLNGKSPLSNKEVMRKLNMTQGQFSYAKRKLVNKLKRLRGV